MSDLIRGVYAGFDSTQSELQSAIAAMEGSLQRAGAIGGSWHGANSDNTGQANNEAVQAHQQAMQALNEAKQQCNSGVGQTHQTFAETEARCAAMIGNA